MASNPQHPNVAQIEQLEAEADAERMRQLQEEVERLRTEMQPQIRLLNTEIELLNLRIEQTQAEYDSYAPELQGLVNARSVLDSEIAELESQRNQLHRRIGGVTSRRDGKRDLLTRLKGDRARKLEELQVLQVRGPQPVIRWAGGGLA